MENFLTHLSRDFFETVSFWTIFGIWNFDFWTGTGVAIKKRCWTSQMAWHGLRKFFVRWFPLLIAEYFCRKSETPQGLSLAVALVSYITYTDFGSGLENIGVISNSKTLTVLGRSLQAQAERNSE